MKNKDPYAPWNKPEFDRPDAPHVKNKDDPDKPWNQVFWHPEDLSVEERKFYGIDFEYYHFKKSMYGKSNKQKRHPSP